MNEEGIRAAFAEQAMWCERLGSPFTALLCRVAGERIDRSTAIGAKMLDWSGDPTPNADNLPARFCGGLHYLVLRGEAPGLSSLYPPAAMPGEDALWSGIAAVLRVHGEMLMRWIESPPQTNEVARSATLMSGLMVIADRFRLPMHLLELGSSAGLNLNLDLYEHDLGGVRAGQMGSVVRLAPRWKGGPPPQAEVKIVRRRGVDLRPVDLDLDSDKLIAFVWADQIDRRERLKAAIGIAKSHSPQVDEGDASDWIDRMLREEQEPCTVRVVMHSVAFQYFPEAAKRRIAAQMEEVGRKASDEKPLAWLRYENQDGDERPSLRLRLWPSGEDRLLAWCHGHGASVKWLI